MHLPNLQKSTTLSLLAAGFSIAIAYAIYEKYYKEGNENKDE